MAFPQVLDPTSPPGTDSPRLGDDQIRALKLFLSDYFGFPVSPTTIAAACGSVASTGKITFTLATWSGDAIAAASGGTGITSYAIGDLLYASAATTLSKLSDVSVGSYLRSGGVTTAPLWSTLTLPNTATTGDLPYASAANTVSMLADVAVGSYLRSGGLSTAPLWSTLLLPNAATIGDIPIATSANTLTMLADVAAGSFLRSGGVATAPAYSAYTLPATAGVAGKIHISDGTNIVSSTPTYPATAGALNNVLTSDGTNWTSAAPSGGVVKTPIGGSGNNSAIGANAFFGPYGSGFSAGAEQSVKWPVPFAGTIKNFRFLTAATQTVGNSVVTVRKNGVNTAISVTVLLNDVAQLYSDTVDSFTVAAGDFLSLQITTTTITGPGSWSLELDPS